MAVKKVAGPRRYFPKDKWKKKEIKEHTLIIGNNEFCVSLTDKLTQNKKPVTILNTDVSVYSDLDNNSYLKIIQSEQINTKVLQDSLYPSSRVIILTDNDADNLLIALLARKKCNIESVYVRINDQELKEIFDDLNITELPSCDIDEVSELLFSNNEE